MDAIDEYADAFSEFRQSDDRLPKFLTDEELEHINACQVAEQEVMPHDNDDVR